MPLQLDETDLAEARRFNRLLSAMPRLRARGRLNISLLQAMLRFAQIGPSWSVIRAGLTTEDREVSALGRSVCVRILRPRGPCRGVYLDIHGGAWVLGNARMDDPVNALIASQCDLAVVSVDYRLAPSHNLTACIEDCEAAALWLIENCRSAFDSETIFLGGESAGAHLAACTALRLRDHGAQAAVRGVVLWYGMYDLSGTESVRNAGPDTLILHGPSMMTDLARLNPGLPEEERRKPSLSPLYASLHELPPAILLAGTLDPLLDDTVLMAERWQEATGSGELVLVPEAPHAFNRFGTRLAEKANTYVRHWLKERLLAEAGAAA